MLRTALNRRRMAVYKKPARWADPANRLFPYQVGFTELPHDFDAAPTDFLRMAPEGVGVHGRMLTPGASVSTTFAERSWMVMSPPPRSMQLPSSPGRHSRPAGIFIVGQMGNAGSTSWTGSRMPRSSKNG